ncbi:ABC transporter permease [Lelliottia wanjuensis]|uniref:Transport permease protein n=1 Tax=Lelliottia wanjuensis TaxID=3050585 RepID=A0AAP4FXE5_9ENTR|nr:MULTISPECIES: ABC transporter permease [unclassified Lelliottia]MDK9365412.1 ABC transporter permease [Lelliottia sp. V106_12]MDK9584431.1 ABC transporter permease [Lelliottia sp. V86_10]MDK9617240.1 ABC transporter permease [Lelliottia sp. V106_9]
MADYFISHSRSHSTLAELWHSRYLIRQLMARDFSVRYHHTLLGWLWAIINPALNMTLYYIVFGLMVRLQAPEYPCDYSWVLLSGLMLWMLFSSTFNVVSESLTNNLHLVKKIYFPRVALTIAATGTCIFDFLLALIWMATLMLIFHVKFRVTYIPLALFGAANVVLSGWGVGCVFAVLRLKFRDFRHLIPFILQALFYLTPVVWTSGSVPAAFERLQVLNPVSGIFPLFRYSLLGGERPAACLVVFSSFSCILLAVVGYICFVYSEAGVMDRE